MREQVPAEVLTYAAQMSHRVEGNKDVSRIIKQATLTPTRAIKLRKAISSAEISKKNEQT